MLCGHVAGHMIRHLDQGQLDLQRSGTEQTRDLGLGPDLVRRIEQSRRYGETRLVAGSATSSFRGAPPCPESRLALSVGSTLDAD